MRAKLAVPLVALAMALPTGATRAAGDDPAPRFGVTCRKPDDAVTVGGDQDRTVFDVKSPTGIGRAVVERKGDAWPKAVVVRLHLKGLEHFKASNGTVAVGAAATIRDGMVEVRQWKGDNEQTPLADGDPLRMAVRAVDRDGKPAARMPLDGGHFEVTLPAAMFAGGPRAITLEWVDFYR